MKNLAMQFMTEAAQNPKVAAAVSTTTMSGSIIGVFLEWIPTYIGVFGGLAGFVLSLVLIRNHIRKDRRESEEHELRLQVLRDQIPK